MDTLGVIDLGEGTVWITSALYDSALVHTLHLSGESALYARFTDDPFFLLSVGGYHPAFQPPGGLPGALYDLDRLRASVDISEDVYFALEAYFAITLEHVPVRLARHPRGVVAVPRRHVHRPRRGRLRRAARVLPVLVHGRLRGVGHGHRRIGRPRAAGGLARGASGGAAALGLQRPRALHLPRHRRGLRVRRRRPRAGRGAGDAERARARGGGAPGSRGVAAGRPEATPVVLAEAVAVEGEVWAAPDADLEAVQDVAPLDRELDHYGAYAIAGPRTLTLAGAGVEGAGAALTWTPSSDYFAPAQYDHMSRSEQLSAPSYEAMTAGVRLGVDGIALPAQDEVRAVTTRYERAVIDGDVRNGLKSDLLAAADGGRDVRPRGGARAHRRHDDGPFALEAVAWATADAVTGRSSGTTGTLPRGGRRAARRAARQRPRGAGARAPAGLRAPAWAGRPPPRAGRPPRRARRPPRRSRRPPRRSRRRTARRPRATPPARRAPMTDELTFLPWLRRGLARALTDPRAGGRPDRARGRVTASVDVLDSQATRDVLLHGPDHVVGLAPGQVLRSEPRADSTEVETTMFPYVELAAPDLPWLYTPAGAGHAGAAAVARAGRGARTGGRAARDARPAACRGCTSTCRP